MTWKILEVNVNLDDNDAPAEYESAVQYILNIAEEKIEFLGALRKD